MANDSPVAVPGEGATSLLTGSRHRARASLDPGGSPSSVDARKFRPDVEGLRAFAVGFVVLSHAGVSGIRSGYVGVDVFFVISGFLITNLLVREAEKRGRVSIVRFYARRAKRILPASTLVVVATVIACYQWLGFIAGDVYATDAKWTAVFSANLHIGAMQTTYLGAQAAPSPFQQMWSLGVEEQFYVAWPLLVLVVALLARVLGNFRLILCGVLLVGGTASFIYSIVETSANPPWGYFSPLTRAWELAFGGLVAVAGPWLAAASARTAAVLGAAGFTGVVVSAFAYSQQTSYPGYAVALPVVSSGTLIAAGSISANLPAERVLGVRPLQWIGARSYSLYLWHWPILVIAAQYVGHPLTSWQRLECVASAVVLAALTYWLVENPVRHAAIFTRRPWLAVLMGLVLIAGCLVFAQWEIANHHGTWRFFTELSSPL